jgi:hypothetical protein
VVASARRGHGRPILALVILMAVAAAAVIL